MIMDTDEAEGPSEDQIRISKEFDVIPKPTFLAMREKIDGQISISNEATE